MTDSILQSTKKILGLAAEYDAFDEDIIMHINTAFNTLTQLGIGPPQGFAIVDENDVWRFFLGDNILLNQVKTYVYLRVKLLFDPPGTSFHIEALNQQLRELEWRLNAQREEAEWVAPAPTT